MNLPPSPVTLRELVAANLRRLRNATNAEPADVVRAAAQFGLQWTASWYASVEKGQKPLSAEQLLALPPILTSAFAYRVSLSDLLLGEGSMHLGQQVEGTTISLHYLRELVTADPFKRSFLDFNEQGAAPEITPAQAAAAKMREIVRANLGDVDIRALARAEAGATDLEAKLARKLGVPEIVVIAAAASCWGRSMAEEREALMNPEEGDPPKAATVSRKITTAITNKLEEATKAAEAKAAIAAATTSVTAEFPLVQLDGPRPKPTEVASESLRERYLRSLPLQRSPQHHAEPEPGYQPEPAYQPEQQYHAEPEYTTDPEPEFREPEYQNEYEPDYQPEQQYALEEHEQYDDEYEEPKARRRPATARAD
ncbi:MAG TPA: hypothetical protein VFC19_30920 [Candidatus Limnocylindrales bacterium]|nr:hypothetical protein [Candidatus Limnocylindrales bacterium]